ncbi:MAG: hypothetical protein AABW79_04795 [Nanoarchaeota archaeon]
MVICPLCDQKISLFQTWKNIDGEKYHEKCWKNQEKRVLSGKKGEKVAREYKRKCNRCGKIWYVPVGKESSMKRGNALNALVGIGTALQGNFDASTQATRNIDARNETLSRIGNCPECHSSNYKQEIVAYSKKR